MSYLRKISYRVSFEADLFPALYAIPSLCLQTIVENAIHHGLHHLTIREKQLQLSVQMHQKNSASFFEITVEDNGIGREASRCINESNPLKKKDSTGMKTA